MTDLERHARELDEQGFTLLEGVMSEELRAAVAGRLEAIFEQEGDRAGWEFRSEPGARRLANLLDKGDVFFDVVANPPVLELARSVLGAGFKLSSLNARSANPGATTGQPLHVDMGMLPDQRGPKGFNTVWMIDAFTAENGALRVIPGSHLRGRRPQEVLEDPLAPQPDEKTITGPAGAVLAFNTHLWHAALPNRSGLPRLALNSFYCRHDQPQQLWQKKWLSAETQAHLSPDMRSLLALDDRRNDELNAEPVETSGFMKA